MTLFGDPGYFAGGPLLQTALFSPDKKRFIVLLRHGRLDRNVNEFSLMMWRTEEVFQSATPTLLVTMASSSNRNAIRDAKWLNNETVAFLGENAGELRQLYFLNVDSRVLRKVTDHPTNLTAYSVNSDATKIAFFAETPVANIWNNKTRREGLTVLAGWLWDLAAGSTSLDPHPQLLLQDIEKTSRQVQVPDGIASGSFSLRPHMSPDGKHIVLITNVRTVPESWREYSNRFVNLLAGRKLPSSEVSDAHRYVVVDAESGKSRVLLDSPVADQSASRVAWSPRSDSVVVTHTYLPLKNTYGKERDERRSKSFAVEVNVASGRFARVDTGELGFAILQRWQADPDVLIFQTGPGSSSPPPGTQIGFQKNGTVWQKLDAIERDREQARIVVEEDLNSPPRLVAENTVNHSSVLLLDLNPWFSEVKFGKVENIRFSGSDGHERNAGLYYPADYSPRTRYPLVIQTHGWSPRLHRFAVNGFSTTSNAAQALAGRGIMVLQVDETDDSAKYTPRDGPQATAVYEGAIDFLDQKGLIDRSRVGVIGFSQTCYYVKYALTHSKYRFAAASVADGHDSGYFEYLLYAGTGDATAELENEGQNGGLPYGSTLKSWVENSPGFNIDKVNTPMLITALNPGSLMREYEWYAASKRLSKPAELLYIQDGSHELEKPWDRMASQGSNVDWFDFWLNGHEDPNPAKAEQYQRWRELRKLQEASAGIAKPN